MTDTNSGQNKLKGLVIGLVAIALAVSLALGIKFQPPTATLEAQAAEAVPLTVALDNGRPTLMEFYADWCTSCQAMAPDLRQIKQTYGDRLNFVMLNVDNGKWLPEVLKYRVDGIPHFVFLDETGEAIAETIGEQPRSILEADLNALLAHNDLPYTYDQGQVSKLDRPNQQPRQSDPRSHGAQVKS
ncbi:thioredoxin family protein [Synechococcus sp. BDU 130192]|uniref:thioredoxin family protein n=1 Tax=Synechococcus sp. BDU 130192 TaxID=2042059 RepID=UPI000C0814E7|nr:thioredoxin family protein [Synechococcus sp. BDU 130192]